MNIQIFGKKKCFDTKKAERWFKERRIKSSSSISSASGCPAASSTAFCVPSAAWTR